ncbi:putative isopenicillin N synthase [Rosa chinensis]|uniref:Putative isopenicillin N synthase n=1 Tax=Rosa chinensis TaxID=74649 RepID=A0A2P6PI91_ROSCH|nr:putative isopenicillin N synthase [Rosa chinensis]
MVPTHFSEVGFLILQKQQQSATKIPIMNCPQDWPKPIVRVQSLSEKGVVPDRYIKPPTERPSSDHPTHANIPIIDFQPLLSSDNGDDELRAKLGRVPDPPNVEMAQPADVEMGQPQTAAEPNQPNHRVLDYWAKILALFCSASGIEMALLSVKSGSELPASFYFLGFTLILGFTCFFVGRCIRSIFEQAAKVLQRVGIFFGVTAIFISITIPFPTLWFKCVTGFIYALCWLTILACNYFHSHLLPVYNKVITSMSSGLLGSTT